jgi:hypothetical protein
MPTVIARGQITVSDIFDGDGCYLSNEAVVIPSNNDGSSPVLTGANTTARVIHGGVQVTPTIGALVVSGCTATAAANVVTITGATADSGYVDIPMSYGGVSFGSKRFSFSKSKIGATGADGLTLGFTNENTTIPCDKDGDNGNYTNTRTVITLLEGVTPLLYDGIGTANGTWKIATTPTNVTVGTITDSGSFVTIGNVSAMTADVATVSYLITGKRANGVAISLTKVHTFNKSKVGATGIQANLPTYITSTKITATTIESPILTGGTINGAVFNGGSFSVKNSIDVEIALINNQGIKVKSGRLFVADDYSQVITGGDTITFDAGIMFKSTSIDMLGLAHFRERSIGFDGFVTGIGSRHGLMKLEDSIETGSWVSDDMYLKLEGNYIGFGGIGSDVVKIDSVNNLCTIDGEASIVGALTVGGTIIGTHKGAVHTDWNFNDIIDGSPWYGLGKSTAILTGSIVGADQLAGYWGIRLRTGNNILDIPITSAPTINGNYIITSKFHQSGQTTVPVTNGAGSGTYNFPIPLGVCTSIVGAVVSMDGNSEYGTLWNCSIAPISTTQFTIKVKNVVNVWGSTVLVHWMMDGY